MAIAALALTEPWPALAPGGEALAPAQVPPPFDGLLDAILSLPGGRFSFEGSVGRDSAAAVWSWLQQQSGAVGADGSPARSGLYGLLRQATAQASSDPGTMRRLRAAIGGDAVAAMPRLANALRYQPLLAQARAFGQILDKAPDHADLVAALRAAPLADPDLLAMVMHVAMAQVSQPARIVAAAVTLSGGTSETDLAWGGFAPLIEALLSHAQDQVLMVAADIGHFADADLSCRAIDRLDRLVGALTAHVSMTRGSRWSSVLEGLGCMLSDRTGAWIEGAAAAVEHALRWNRKAAADEILSALNRLYVLSALYRASWPEALSGEVGRQWDMLGASIEQAIEANIDALRDRRGDAASTDRLEVAIKMAALRFGLSATDVLAAIRNAGGLG